MAQSLIKQGICTICTEMTGGEPMKIGLSRSTLEVIYTTDGSPLLNTDDRKLSDQFECKIATKFWGGLQMLTAALCVGGLIIATVATGGLALVAAGVAIAAGAVSIGSGIGALYKRAHDCDCTLESEWLQFHDKATIEGKPALLQGSLLKCQKGGMISLILNPDIAKAVAIEISDNNSKEVYAHWGSQFVQGVLTVATGRDPISFIVAAPLSVYFYCKGETEKDERRATNTETMILSGESTNPSFRSELGGALEDEGINAGFSLPGEIFTNTQAITKTNQAITQEINEAVILGAERELAGDVSGAASARLAADIGSRSYQGWGKLASKTGWGLLKGLGWGLLNFAIDYGSDQYENKKFEETIDAFKKARRDDAQSKKLSVIAQTK